jgi:hypothetical protein
METQDLLRCRNDMLEKIIYYLAKQQYDEEIVMCEADPQTRFPYEEKEWIKQTIQSWFDEARAYFDIKEMASKPKIEIEKIENNVVKNKFYNMNIGDSFEYNDFKTVIRVPGGWVLDSIDDTLFIPFTSKDSCLV